MCELKFLNFFYLHTQRSLDSDECFFHQTHTCITTTLMYMYAVKLCHKIIRKSFFWKKKQWRIRDTKKDCNKLLTPNTIHFYIPCSHIMALIKLVWLLTCFFVWFPCPSFINIIQSPSTWIDDVEVHCVRCQQLVSIPFLAFVIQLLPAGPYLFAFLFTCWICLYLMPAFFFIFGYIQCICTIRCTCYLLA